MTDTVLAFPEPFNGADSPIVNAIATPSGFDIDPILNPLSVGPDSIVTPTLRPSITAIIDLDPWDQTYGRAWSVPQSISLVNPNRDTPIPFSLWNARRIENDLTLITALNADGLTLSPSSVPITFGPVEQRDFNITIDNTDSLEINSTYQFTFETGITEFEFSARLAELITLQFEQGVTEIWSWLTNTITSDDSSEQRIALRGVPRRSLEFSFTLDTEQSRSELYRRLFTAVSSSLLVPYLQHAALGTQDVIAGETRIFFDPQQTDIREGELLALVNECTGETEILRVLTLESDGATLSDPTVNGVDGFTAIVPVFDSRLERNTGLTMDSVSGTAQIRSISNFLREEFKRPNSSATITTFDGLPVLDRCPLAGGNTEIFDYTFEELDGDETGITNRVSGHTRAFISGNRAFRFKRSQRGAEMDFWRDFLFDLRGQQGEFLFATWLQDLTVSRTPDGGSNLLFVNELEYANQFFALDDFKRLQIQTASGIQYNKVVSVNIIDGNEVQLSLQNTLPENITDIEISYLLRSRLNSDDIRLVHTNANTTVSLSVRSIEP